MIQIVAVIGVVFFAILALLIFAGSHGGLSDRIDALAENQISLSKIQTQLSENQSELSQAIQHLSNSQIEITSAYQEIAPLLAALSHAQDKTTDELQQLSQAVRQQTVVRLRERLIALCSGDRSAAREQYELEKSAAPGKGDDWYFKQAISRLMSPPNSIH